jgi:hypothetical protein
MELEKLDTIAQQLFEILPESLWRGKGADEIEGELQKVVSQIGNRVMGQHAMAARITELEQEVEEGVRRCECGGRYQVHKRQVKIHPKSVFGAQEVTRTQYVCIECGQYEVVADRVLGIESPRMPPRLATMVALCGASWSYPVASAFLTFFLGVEVCTKTVCNLTCGDATQPAPLAPDPLKAPPGVVEMDGVLIQGRVQDQWLERKVGSFFSQTAEVSRDRREVLDASFVGSACQAWQEFEQPVTLEAQRRGLRCDEPIEFIADGASGIWSLQEVVFPNARPRLDLYHGKCKVTKRVAQAFGDSPVQVVHQTAVMECFETGQVNAALAYLNTHRPTEEKAASAIDKLTGYLARHRARIPNYHQVRDSGGTVSSGLGEKANDLIVVRRMKDPLMHWSRKGADPLIQHRTTFINQFAHARSGSYETAFCFNQ